MNPFSLRLPLRPASDEQHQPLCAKAGFQLEAQATAPTWRQRPSAQPSAINFIMDWYCIHTRPQKEDSTCAYYQDTLGIETYSPKLRQQRVIRRVRRIVVRPLFPRYIFCRFEPALHYRAVKYAPDTIDVVHCGRAPAIVPDQLITDLKTWVGSAFDADDLQPRFQSGDVVQIESGPLMGLRAIVQQDLTDSERVAVLLSILDCGARTLLPRNQLRLVG